MHDYMRAVGFSEMDKSELRKVIKSVIDEPKCEYATDGEDAVIAERSKDVGRILRTFKIKKNVEVTDNGKIII